MQTNLPCKQIEKKREMWQHHSPPKKNKKKTNPTDQKHPRDRSNEGKKGKTMWFCLLSRYRRGAKQLETG